MAAYRFTVVVADLIKASQPRRHRKKKQDGEGRGRNRTCKHRLKFGGSLCPWLGTGTGESYNWLTVSSEKKAKKTRLSSADGPEQPFSYVTPLTNHNKPANNRSTLSRGQGVEHNVTREGQTE